MAHQMSLISTKNSLLETLNPEQEKIYFKLLQLWFQAKIDKRAYDYEMTQLLTNEQNVLHNKFILVFLYNYMKENRSKYLFADSNDCKTNTLMGNELSNDHLSRKREYNEHAMEVGEDEKIGLGQHQDKKLKIQYDTSIISMENIASCSNNIKPLLNINRANFLLGLIQIISWTEGLQDGVRGSSDISIIIYHALNIFLKNLITTVISQKKSFQIKREGYMCNIGKHVSNPWLRSSNSHRINYTPRYPCVATNEKHLNKKSESIIDDDDDHFNEAMQITNSYNCNIGGIPMERNDKLVNTITKRDILHTVLNNINNVIPNKQLKSILYEKILFSGTVKDFEEVEEARK